MYVCILQYEIMNLCKLYNTYQMFNVRILQITINTIKQYWRKQGWVCTRPHYCQLIRELNKRKRVVWCKEALRSNVKFLDVIFTDECTVQLEQHGRLCFRKKLHPRQLKQRPKHPVKLHIWGVFPHVVQPKLLCLKVS